MIDPFIVVTSFVCRLFAGDLNVTIGRMSGPP